MSSYALLRPALFALDAERAHHLTLRSLQTLERLKLLRPRPADAPECPRHAMGLTFPNPVGLAAGLDKNGDYIDALATLGFGFIEIGTVTPRPQPGNPRPRMFRLPQASALINRLGFNNHGVDRLVENVKRARWRGVLGINIGKNFDTPNERAADDYVLCLRKVYGHASYVTVNISSPNTKGLRELQGADHLDGLLGAISTERTALEQHHGRRVPVALKIAPDLEAGHISAVADLVATHGVDAVIATNTTLARDGVSAMPFGNEAGGLSGGPLTARSTDIVAQLTRALSPSVPVIGVGGIMSGRDARAKLDAGARLVQIYTGLIYRGPELVRDCVQATCEVAA